MSQSILMIIYDIDGNINHPREQFKSSETYQGTLSQVFNNNLLEILYEYTYQGEPLYPDSFGVINEDRGLAEIHMVHPGGDYILTMRLISPGYKHYRDLYQDPSLANSDPYHYDISKEVFEGNYKTINGSES